MLTLSQQIAAIRRDHTLTTIGRMAKIHNLLKKEAKK
jgi:hypothetical protein